MKHISRMYLPFCQTFIITSIMIFLTDIVITEGADKSFHEPIDKSLYALISLNYTNIIVTSKP